MSARTETLRRQDEAGSGRRSARGWRGVLLALVGLVLALAAVYVGAAYALADRVPYGTEVGGEPVGGLAAEDAVATLRSSVGEEAAEPVRVAVGEDRVEEIDPAAAGLAVDLEATVAGLTGFSLDPTRMWQHVTGEGSVPVVTTVDTDALVGELEALAAATDVAPVDGDVTFPGGVPTANDPVEGRELDVEAAAAVVQDGWLDDDEPLALPEDTVPVDISQADVEAGLEVAQAAVAGPLVVVVGEREVELAPDVFGDTLAMEPDGEGALRLGVDGERLRAATLAVDEELQSEPRDATIRLADGRPEVVPGRNGRSLPADALQAAALTALAPGGDRRAVVEGATTEPDVTTAEVEALGVTEVVSTFSTNYPDNPPRTNNLRVAAETIRGTLLLPGDVFDLNEVLGERTTAKGYRAAGVISNGRFTEGVGGGVSQVATTTYNAAFFAGLEVLDFKPHSYYISRYPVGRESTLNYSPPVDMRFRNDTDTGILVDASVGGGEITVTFWGTKTWDVESVTSPRRDVEEGGVTYDDSPDCEPQGANTGFSVDTTRIWKDLDSGAEVKRETNTWRYSTGDRIICGEDPDA
ncbi:VanW family protein [Aquipuribacter sp. SD81]|uniref:VanW family protein n=1 Tax=Aquipuribacter sp. SD81 TaxID=3127703 RepID=UPI0030176349